MSYVDPDPEGWALFKSLPRDGGPIHMLNLVKVRPLAEYPEGHPNHGKGMSGLDAYRAYGRTTAHILKRLGARQVWLGRPDAVVTGPQSELWDIAFIAEYPNGAAFLAMVTDPEYRECVKHRTAGVTDSRLVRMAPLEPGAGFGEAAG
jgi:hypothetical protein